MAVAPQVLSRCIRYYNIYVLVFMVGMFVTVVNQINIDGGKAGSNPNKTSTDRQRQYSNTYTHTHTRTLITYTLNKCPFLKNIQALHCSVSGGISILDFQLLFVATLYYFNSNRLQENRRKEQISRLAQRFFFF